MSTIDLVASVVALVLGPMLAEVGPGYQTKSIVLKKGAKGAVVVLIVRAFDCDCVCAHLAHLAHEFSINFICKHMSSRFFKSRDATDAQTHFLGFW